MSTRFGRLKQLEAVGPNGEILLEYSLWDARQAGFTEAVFVVQDGFAQQFEERLFRQLRHYFQVRCVVQKVQIAGTTKPYQRERPWGTGHALLVAAAATARPFAVINADDYYGPEAITTAYSFLSEATNSCDTAAWAIVGYRLINTLSNHGPVTRAICELSQDSALRRIIDVQNIELVQGRPKCRRKGDPESLIGNEVVSVNVCAFATSPVAELEDEFRRFLSKTSDIEREEFGLPDALNNLVLERRARVRVYVTESQFVGLTYPADRVEVAALLERRTRQGKYPRRLWKHPGL